METSISRRNILQASGIFAAPVTAGCVFYEQRGPTDVTVYNEREREVAATVRFVDCSITDELTKTASVAAGNKQTLNHVVREHSGTCTIAVETGDGLTDRFDWQVRESTLDIRIDENEIEFSPK